MNFIPLSRLVSRESFLFLLIILTLYFYVKGVKLYSKNSIWASAFFGVLLALTSDFVIFVLPALVLSYIIFNKEKLNFRALRFSYMKYAFLPIIFILISYGGWLAVKYSYYSKYEFYPNGLEGAPLDTQGLGLLQVISPQSFSDYEGSYIKSGFVAAVKKLAFYFGYMFNLEPFSIPLGINFTTMKFLLKPIHLVYMAVIYLPLALFALYSFLSLIIDFLKTKRLHNNVELYMLGLFFIFLFPMTQKYSSPRYLLVSYIALFYIISYCLVKLLKKRKLDVRYKIIPAVIILLVLILPFWYYNNNYFVLFNGKVVSAQNTGDYIRENLPRDAGIMVQPGYTVKLIYLTGNRIVGLDPHPERLGRLIDYFDIDYIVIGRLYTWDEKFLSKRSVDYIINNPHKFELIDTVEEDYSDFYSEENKKRNDKLYIYRVKRS